MSQFLPRDRVWVRNEVHLRGEPRMKGVIIVIKPDQTQAVIELDDGDHIRVPTGRLTLRESHE